MKRESSSSLCYFVQLFIYEGEEPNLFELVNIKSSWATRVESFGQFKLGIIMISNFLHFLKWWNECKSVWACKLAA